ncbi:hypothetical protein BCR33DRAFT_224 [Rhizoclosmatium globosum]|uniref:ATP-dependent DNA helicase n=1 Tax=Rhizoclosmatium globosum TaxID=329046 RepID=A0A1Y2D2A2_9FUNG|nr:hypothetical protein BCR33DRAFT_224 [Rhizoclosmatium globosum]|eukprot:ORY53421.1 hypothetical protein BCR33DRAFT_224 [Rhizoclosmatium globosum]
MLDGEFFGKLDGVLKKLDRNAGSNTPFGGIQIVLCGDFAQLPPVSTAGRVAQFAFETQSWKDAIKRESCIVLSEIHRQTDTRLISILNELRSGVLTPATNNILSNQYFPLQIPFGMKPVQL